MRQTLIAMASDAEGTRLLQQLKLDGFVAGDERLYDGVAEMMRVVQEK